MERRSQVGGWLVILAGRVDLMGLGQRWIRCCVFLQRVCFRRSQGSSCILPACLNTGLCALSRVRFRKTVRTFCALFPLRLCTSEPHRKNGHRGNSLLRQEKSSTLVNVAHQYFQATVRYNTFLLTLARLRIRQHVI